MALSPLERLFSFLRTIMFQQIGNKIPTNSLKGIMDVVFILFEKIGCNFDIISAQYLRLYQDIVRKEITLASISKNDSVLVIGSGSLPATPLLIAQYTSASVLSIDKDRSAVIRATRYIRTHHRDGSLRIEHADGRSYPVEGFSIIIVLYGVKHPQALLEYLSTHINADTRVILRVITTNSGELTDKTIHISEHFKIKDKIHTESLGSFDSFLLMKKP